MSKTRRKCRTSKLGRSPGPILQYFNANALNHVVEVVIGFFDFARGKGSSGFILLDIFVASDDLYVVVQRRSRIVVKKDHAYRAAR